MLVQKLAVEVEVGLVVAVAVFVKLVKVRNSELLMATTCLRSPFLSTSLIPGLRPNASVSEQIWQPPPVQKHFISAELQPSAIAQKVRRPFVAHATSLSGVLGLVSGAQALEESDAVSTYEAFVKGTSSAARAVASESGDAFSDVLGDNAALIGGVVVLAVGVTALVSILFRKGYEGDVSGREALDILEKESGSFLVDIRQNKEIAEEGSPKVRGKKAVRVQYQIEKDESVSADPAFVSKVEKRASKKDAAIYVIDMSGKASTAAAKSLTQAGYTKVYVIKGGTDAWLASELPWLQPTSFKIDLGGLKEAVDATVKVAPAVLPATIGITAAAAGSFLLFSEAETALQLLGLAGVTQAAVQKFLFAEDRKKTLQQLKTFLDTKVAPQELVDEIKEIGNALLPVELAKEGSGEASKAAPSEPTPSKPAALSEPAASKPAASNSSDSKRANGSSQKGQNGKVVSEDAAKTDSSLPPPPTPLSPYAMYPDMKPPASPTPSKLDSLGTK